MKTLITLFYKLTNKDFDKKIKRAKQTRRMIVASTNGNISHFYNMEGERIRGYSNTIIRSRKVEHPLIAKYK
jgi:hypothetical protein